MITAKKITIIRAILLAGIAFLASCEKAPSAHESNKGKNAVPSANTQKHIPEVKGSLQITRDGQYGSLNWHIEPPVGKIKQISIVRNATGMFYNMRRVGEVDPMATSFRDCLPDANAHWYWLRIEIENQKFQFIGPVRVSPDKAGSAHYSNPEDKYKITITRTDDLAMLQWDFPENEYKTIRVTRYSRSVTEPQATGSTHVVTTLEPKSQCANALPDPNSDYWYWFRITLKSGVIVYKGPIKGEYANQ